MGQRLYRPEWGWFHDKLVLGSLFDNVPNPQTFGSAKTALTVTGSPASLAGTAGRGVEFNSSTDGYDLPDTYLEDNFGTSFTHLFVVDWDGSAPTTPKQDLMESRGSAQGITLEFSGGNLQGVVEVSGGANGVPQYTPTIPAGLVVLCHRWDGTTEEVRVSTDRFNPATASISGTITDAEETPVIGNEVSGSKQLGIGIALQGIYFFSEHLSLGAIFQIFDDPFGPFRRPMRLVGFEAVAEPVVTNDPDTDAGLFIAGQQQPVIERAGMIPY